MAKACGDDDSLRPEVESLLAYEDQAEDFIESPALEIAAQMMAEERSGDVLVSGNRLCGQQAI